MDNLQGVDSLDKEIDDLFKDSEDSQLQTEQSKTDEQGAGDNTQKPAKSELTQNMIDRINTVKRETEKEVQEKIAKENGFDSYTAMKQAKEAKLLSDKGFNKDDVEAVIKPMVEQRIADDARFKELEDFKRAQQEIYINQQLSSINKTTGQQLKITDLPKETISLWEKGIDLEQAYYATHGKTLLTKGISHAQNGSLTHLGNSSANTNVKTRSYTQEEKNMYASIMNMGGFTVSDKELAEKTVSINKED